MEHVGYVTLKLIRKYIFDSFGGYAPSQLVKYIGSQQLYYNAERIQNFNEFICRHLCIFVLKIISMNYTWSEISNIINATRDILSQWFKWWKSYEKRIEETESLVASLLIIGTSGNYNFHKLLHKVGAGMDEDDVTMKQLNNITHLVTQSYLIILYGELGKKWILYTFTVYHFWNILWL